MLANLWRSVAREIVAAAQGEDRPAIRPISSPVADLQPAVGPTSESVFHAAALKYLDQQVATNDRLDARSAQNFQVGSTVVTIAFGLLSFSRDQIPDRAEYSLWAALTAYGLVLVFCFVASLFRRMAYRPEIPIVRRYVDDLSGDDLQLWVSLEYMSSIEINEPVLKWKNWLVAAATLCLYVEGACLAVAALFTLL